MSVKILTITFAYESRLSTTKLLAASELRIPLEKNLNETISIIELLNKEWDQIPPAIQQSALNFIKEKKGILEQLDAVAVVEQVY